MNKIALYREEARACTVCRDAGLVHRDTERGWAFPLFDRNPSSPAGILAIAEAPNKDDSFLPEKGYLTYDVVTDPTGNSVFDLLESVGLAVTDVMFTNSVLCLPKRKDNGKYTVRAPMRDACRPWLQRLTEDLDARVVITFGGEALAAVAHIEAHALKLKTDAGRTQPWFGRQLLPLYHPGRLARSSRSEAQQLADITALLPYLRSIDWQPLPRLAEGVVGPREHLILSIEGKAVARVAPYDPRSKRHFVFETLAREHRDDALQSAKFYLVDKGEQNPWAYAHYHATSASNVYARVQWSAPPAHIGRF